MDVLRGKTLVIFGCGYIGSATAAHALARGLKVTALTRNAEKARHLRDAGITTVVAELAAHDWHAEVASAPDFVLNCVSSGGGGPEDYRRSYVDGMRSILGWAERHGRIGTVVYTSSTSVYPQGDDVEVTEDSGHEGVSERGAILLEAERLLRAGERARACGFVLRLAGIYGPGRHYLLEQIRSGVVSGVGEHRLNLIHRDDIVAAVFACLEASVRTGRGGGGGDVFNLADDRPTPKREVVAWLAGRMGLPRPEFSGEPAGGRRALVPNRRISNTRLKATLGWRPRFPDFRAGYESVLSD